MNISVKRVQFIPVALLMVIMLAACSPIPVGTGSYASIPAGKGYAEGSEIYFSHTEVSDPAVGEKLTNMMKSPVIVVPSLAQIPVDLTSPVYVFQNGIRGKGPLGFQEDVFASPPGSEAYTPLRQIIFVSWSDKTKPRLVTSERAIMDLEKNSEISLNKSGIVVNMPFMVWEGGKR